MYMKKTLVVLSILAVLAPAVASADTKVSATAEASVYASTTKPRHVPLLPKLGPAIKVINKAASSTRGGVKERVAQIKSAIAQHREETEKRAEETKENARKHFGEAVQKSVSNILDHLTRAAGDLAGVARRIDAYIKVEQGKGLAMSGSASALAQAQANIVTANAKIADVATALNAALASTSPKAAMPAVRTATKTAQDALKTAKQSLQQTLRTVRLEVSATTTASTSISVH